ncbi:hypothetical protein F5Y09DRAFT_335956 [Xylaria sp. FL1042]|nr:hypothetical protein F5Y09DRAFT_335956 [Xylaria sp. FL1042]
MTVTIELDNQSSSASDTSNGGAKGGRTPLKQLPESRSTVPRPSAPLRRRRKRIGGKRTVRSCTSCRAAHVRCVADRYGVPCERCAKKSWLDCTLMQIQQEKAPAKIEATGQPDTVELNSSQTDGLKKIASDALVLMDRAVKPGSP